MHRLAVPLAVVATLALAACGKVQEKAAEKVAEKAIEASMAKDGTQAKVDLSNNAIKVTTTDAAGKTTQMEMGNAQISEAELGLPFYPGSKPAEGGAMRMVNADNTALHLGLRSADAPDKVAAFYREKMKAMAAGKQFVDMASAEGASLSLSDDKGKSALQVHVAKDDQGSAITITSTRGAN